MIVLKIYLWLCLAIFVTTMAICVYEDFIRRHRDHKFGWNFQWPPWRSFGLIMACILSCPVINVLLILQIVYNRISEGPPPEGSPAWHDLQKKKAAKLARKK